MDSRASTLTLLAALFLAVPSLASEPGTPMDCSDLELAPGLTCTQLTPIREFGVHREENGFFADFPFRLPEDLELDNDRRRIVVTGESIADVGTCGTSNLQRRTLLSVGVGNALEPIAIAETRSGCAAA